MTSLEKDSKIAPNHSQNRHVYRVSELNQDVRTLLETGFPQLWLEGEISNFACPSSGHWYFSLKDSRAQVRCCMFKNKNRSTGFTPKQGDNVLAKAKISLYEARGEYQLIIESMEEAGFGALQRAFDELKSKLQKEGLFSSAVKRSLPTFPKQIGVISSPTGAAIRDILSVLKRRFPSAPVVLYPVVVQGETSATQIVEALEIAQREKHCDVLILARGGGSLEDLWSFNEEIVARAIFHCQVPIVSGIGHEIDFTIADFVADYRAATPSAAAESVVPNHLDVQSTIHMLHKRLLHHMVQLLTNKQENLRLIGKRIKHPSQQLREKSQRLDELEIRLFQAIKHLLSHKKISHQQVGSQLNYFNPNGLLTKHQKTLEFLNHRLTRGMKNHVSKKSSQFAATSHALHTVSPLATIGRGYAIVSLRDNDNIVRSRTDVKLNDTIKVRLSDGQLLCSVKETNAN